MPDYVVTFTARVSVHVRADSEADARIRVFTANADDLLEMDEQPTIVPCIRDQDFDTLDVALMPDEWERR